MADADTNSPAAAEVAELVRFQEEDIFLEIQHEFIDEALGGGANADKLLQSLETRLEVYQEQPYLLDPLLAKLVSPPADAIQRFVRTHPCTQDTLTSRQLSLCCRLLYTYTKVRGAKVVCTSLLTALFLTHNVEDLVPVLKLVEVPGNPSWHVVYVLVLWLGLICLVPFSLNDVAGIDQIEHVARRLIVRSGRERDAAAMLLGNLYRRRDVGSAHFSRFLDWARSRLRNGAGAFEITGILETLCMIVKNGDASFIQHHIDEMATILDEHMPFDGNNTLIDRYRAKLSCRLALRVVESSQMKNNVDERVDVLVDELLRALRHPDLVVRYSGAKGIARICAKIPPYFSEQVIRVVLELLTENVPAIPDTSSGYDPAVQRELDAAVIDAVSDATWNGAILALAELSRRALVPTSLFGCVIYWTLRALFFEQRRGLGAIGTSVRDAACYVLWASARLKVTMLEPFANAVSTRLAIVMTLDREVTIRRAASAAFQEWVGRTSLIPNGIDALREADFSAVGVRRNAYVICAPRIARYVGANSIRQLFTSYSPPHHSFLPGALGCFCARLRRPGGRRDRCDPHRYRTRRAHMPPHCRCFARQCRSPRGTLCCIRTD